MNVVSNIIEQYNAHNERAKEIRQKKKQESSGNAKIKHETEIMTLELENEIHEAIKALYPTGDYDDEE